MCHSGTFSVHQFSAFWIFQAGNTAIALVGKPQGNPWTIHSKTLQEHPLGSCWVFPEFSWLGHSNHMTQDILNVLNIPHPGKIAKKLVWKILNVFSVYWVGTLWLLCPFPYNVLTVFQLRSLDPAPSESSNCNRSSNRQVSGPMWKTWSCTHEDCRRVLTIETFGNKRTLRNYSDKT